MTQFTLFGRTLRNLSIGAMFVATGCAEQAEVLGGIPAIEGAAPTADGEAIQITESPDGESFRASLLASSFSAYLRIDGIDVYAAGERTGEDDFYITISVGEEVLAFDYVGDTMQFEAENFSMTEDIQQALTRFVAALYNAHPDTAGLSEKVYRASLLASKHSPGMVVEPREILRSADLRSVDSMCEEYYRGDWYTGYFDYECNCSWGFCDQCSASWGSTIGGPNGDTECYGACGAGCDSGSDYSKDCAIHDGCANAGYDDWECADEFASATDDWAYGGAPHCGEWYFSYDVNTYASTYGSTNSAQNWWFTSSITLTAGQQLTVGTTGVRQATGFGDTYLRLYKDGAQVAYNDDSGSLLSKITHTAATSGSYEVRMGCYGSSTTCGGKVAYTIR